MKLLVLYEKIILLIDRSKAKLEQERKERSKAPAVLSSPEKEKHGASVIASDPPVGGERGNPAVSGKKFEIMEPVPHSMRDRSLLAMTKFKRPMRRFLLTVKLYLLEALRLIIRFFCLLLGDSAENFLIFSKLGKDSVILCNNSFCKYKKMEKKIRFLSKTAFILILISTIITSSVLYFFMPGKPAGKAANFYLTQSDWSLSTRTNQGDCESAGGTWNGSTGKCYSPRTGWTSYDAKDTNIDTSTAGEAKLAVNTTSYTETSDTDFNETNLVGEWAMDEGTGSYANDTSGNGNNGTHYGQSLSFDGGDYVQTTNESNFDFDRLSAFSLEAWVKSVSTDSILNIIAKNSSALGYTFWIVDGRLQLRLERPNDYLGPHRIVVSETGANLRDGLWHHVAMTYNGSGQASGVSLYVDGNLRTISLEEDNLNGSLLNGANLSIGGAPGWGGNFKGSIDKAKVYARELSSTEVGQHYQGIFTGNTDLRGSWHFKEGTGQTVADDSGLGNNGTLGADSGSSTDDPTWQTDAPAIWNSSGKYGKAMNFDGTDDYVNAGTGSLSLTDGGQITMSAWIYTTAFHNGFIVQRAPVNARWELFLTSTGYITMRGNSTANSLVSTSTIPLNEWVHVAGTINGTTGNIYINGANVRSGTISPIADTATAIEIGKHSGNSYYFNGKIDDVRVYNTALTGPSSTKDCATEPDEQNKQICKVMANAKGKGNAVESGTGSSANIKLYTPYNLGNGADGAVTITTAKNINTDNMISGRTCADGGDAVNYSVTVLTSNTATLSSTPSAGCLVAGDEVMIINLKGIFTNYANVGNYEFLHIQSISTNTITFTTNKTKYYGDNSADDTNLGIADTNQRVMLQRVPNYTNLTINTGGSLVPAAWNGIKNGVIAFRANGTVTVNTANGINANGKGHRGGDPNSEPLGGESYNGRGSMATNGAGGGGGGESIYSATGTFGTGGGHAANDSGGSSPALHGGAGGGGNGSSGFGGQGGGNNGNNGSVGVGGNGSGESNFGGLKKAGGAGGGGNDGRTADGAGSSNLNGKVYFGGGGGTCSMTYFNCGGGAGGGIIIISSQNFNIANSSSITAGGSNGGNNSFSGGGHYGGGAGGGAGGSIIILSPQFSNSGTITVSGGTGGTGTAVANGYASNDGGAGGAGRTYLKYTSITGSAPTENYYGLNQVQYASSGTFTSQIKDLGTKVSSWGNMSWTNQIYTPSGSSIELKARSCPDATCSTNPSYASITTITTDGASGSASLGALATGNRYVQYQAALSTPDNTATPTFSDVTIGYNSYPAPRFGLSSSGGGFWSSRRPITITGSTIGAQTNYSVHVSLTSALGTPSYDNINANGSDIRFVNSNGTELPYWIETWNDGGNSSVWVKVDLIPASPSTATIYMYYNNASATSSSSQTNAIGAGLVAIGSQIWSATNLNVTTNPAGGAITRQCPYASTSFCATYGGLYTWYTLMNGSASCNGVCTNADCTGVGDHQSCSPSVQGICPTGFHVPSHYEWNQLERAVCTSGTCATDFPYNTTTTSWRGTDEGTKLKQGGSSGFEAMLAGYRGGAVEDPGIIGRFWASTIGWHHDVSSSTTFVYRDPYGPEDWAYSVRCVKGVYPEPSVGALGSADNFTINTLTSSPYNTTDAAAAVDYISWGESTPAGTNIRFQVRTAPNVSSAPAWATGSGWCGPASCGDPASDTSYADSYYDTTPGGQTLNSIHVAGGNDQWIQYKVWFVSDGSNTPVLNGYIGP